jgi:hypothetical protein
MNVFASDHRPIWPLAAWFCVVLAGVIAPFVSVVLIASSPSASQWASASGPILAVGLMGAGMIGASAAGRFGFGLALAILVGAGLFAFAYGLGEPALPSVLPPAIAVAIASLSFAARGALFARSAADKGWLIAVFVVAGEAAIILTAFWAPGSLPHWLLVLLPAQWTSMAVHSVVTGSGLAPVTAPLIALAGTAAATLFVASMWPRRWPYLVMFTTWLSLSALVWHQTAPWS